MKKMSYNVSASYAAETHRKNRLEADGRLSVGILYGENWPSYLTNDSSEPQNGHRDQTAVL
jgi:hypothetical protein